MGKRLLSPEEIQALLSHARDSGDHTHTTSVPGHTHDHTPIASEIVDQGELTKSEENEREGEGGEGRGEEGEGQSLQELREAGFDQSLGFSPCPVEGEKPRFEDFSPQVSGGFEYSRGQEQSSADHAEVEEEIVMEPPVDHSGQGGGEGDVPPGSHTSVESWMVAEDVS